MSIQLNILEKRLSSVENALMFLSDSLGTAFPTAGISFDSISTGLLEVHKEIENYKADKIRIKRDDVFLRYGMISRDDLCFLVKQYARALQESPTCDRVYKANDVGGLRTEQTFIFDLSNLSLVAQEFGISPNNLVSHKLDLIVTLGHGVDMQIRETATLDMETVSYITNYSPDVHPLVKHRIINWFYTQIDQHLGSSAWCLPAPDRGKNADRHIALSEMRLRPVEPIVEEALEAGKRMLLWADNNKTVSYGVALKNPTQKNLSTMPTVLQLIARRNAETGAMQVHLWNPDPAPFGQVNAAINFIFEEGKLTEAEKYEEFVATVESFPLNRLAKVYNLIRSIRFFEPTVEDSSVKGFEGDRYRVEYIVGDKLTVEE